MRRLVMAAILGLVTFAQLGPEPSSSAASTVPRHHRSGRERSTAVDRARESLPLPRASTTPAVMAPRAATTRTSRGQTLPRGDVWAALARCESGGNAAARSGGGRYSGAFQFSDATWQSLGFTGSAADHSFAEQVVAAQRLQARSGWGQWPRCARRLGLR